MSDTVGADEAIRRLGISRATLYSYVSRGWLRAMPDATDPRISRYARVDVDRLASRQRRGRRADEQSLTAMEEGWPLIGTRLSRVVDGQLMYRDRPALELARTSSVEDVARWLWQTGEHDPFAGQAPALPPLWEQASAALRERPVAERCTALFALAQTALTPETDTLAHTADGAAACGTQLRLLAACFHGQTPTSDPLPLQFVNAWSLPPQLEPTLRETMALLADHEMNMIPFVGRCVASVGAPLGAAMLAALCHVGASFFGSALPMVEALWDELAQEADPAAALALRLADAPQPGFNHPDYPQGDPRGARLMALAIEHTADAPQRSRLRALAQLQPTIDFGLVALRRALGLPADAAAALLHTSRSIGVIAHVLEQRRSGHRLVARAKYLP